MTAQLLLSTCCTTSHDDGAAECFHTALTASDGLITSCSVTNQSIGWTIVTHSTAVSVLWPVAVRYKMPSGGLRWPLAESRHSHTTVTSHVALGTWATMLTWHLIEVWGVLVDVYYQLSLWVLLKLGFTAYDNNNDRDRGIIFLITVEFSVLHAHRWTLFYSFVLCVCV